MRELVRTVSEFSRARGWHRHHTLTSLVLAVCSEAGELAHLVRWHAPHRRPSMRLRAEIADEVADILIFLLCLCDRLGYDPDELVRGKLESNAHRFPESPSGDANGRSGR